MTSLVEDAQKIADMPEARNKKILFGIGMVANACMAYTGYRVLKGVVKVARAH